MKWFDSCSLNNSLRYLDVSINPLTQSIIKISRFQYLIFLNLSQTILNIIQSHLFKGMPYLSTIDISSLPITINSFPDIYMFNTYSLSTLYVVVPEICCMISNDDTIECISDFTSEDVFADCTNIINDAMILFLMGVYILLITIFHGIGITWQLISMKTKYIKPYLMTSLSLSDGSLSVY